MSETPYHYRILKVTNTSLYTAIIRIYDDRPEYGYLVADGYLNRCLSGADEWPIFTLKLLSDCYKFEEISELEVLMLCPTIPKPKFE